MFESTDEIRKMDEEDGPPPGDELFYQAWVIIANVSGGAWNLQSSEWQEAAIKWRDAYHARLGLKDG